MAAAPARVALLWQLLEEALDAVVDHACVVNEDADEAYADADWMLDRAVEAFKAHGGLPELRRLVDAR